jgi:hypothetical protein
MNMSDPTTAWIKFEDRSPTQEEQNSDRVVGYFRIQDLSGVVTTDHFGKLFWVDEEDTWAIEIFSNALRLTAPGQFEYEPVKPSHWCLVPPLPDHPELSRMPET